MTDRQKELLEKIKYQITMDDLSKEFSLTQKQIYQRINNLKISGYNIFRKDFANGRVQFGLSDSLKKSSSSKILYTLPGSRTLRAIIASDTHLGNTKQRLDVLNDLYEYCIKNNIHVILNCGDFLNGLGYSSVGKPIDNYYLYQIENALKSYPFEPNIINYIILGNHDKDYLKGGSIDIASLIERRRYDILPISYDEGIIKVKNDELFLIHPSEKYNPPKLNNKITFRGHTHISKIKDSDSSNSTYIYVPACSDLLYDKEYRFPSMYDATFSFNAEGIISELNINNFVYLNEFVKVGEFSKTFNVNEKYSEIKYEEHPKVLKKQITNNMSQIEKFNTRYNIKK